MTVLDLASLLSLFLVAIALAVALLRDVLAATVVFAAYSLGIAIVWIALQAPDVALTEAAVGAGVTTSLFLVAIVKTGRPVGEAILVRDVRPRSVLVAVGAVGVVGATVPALPAVGAPDAPPFQRVAPHYLEQSLPLLGIENVVTAILAGYRAFDTFGEVAVVFAAGIAVLVVAGREVL